MIRGSLAHAGADDSAVLWCRVLPELSPRDVEIGESRGFKTRRVAPDCLNTDSVSTRPVRASANGEHYRINLARLDALTAK